MTEQLQRAVQFANPVTGDVGNLRWSKLTKRFRWIEEDLGYDTPCWTWQFHIGQKGYGFAKWDDRMRLAHRAVYERLVGPVPGDLTLDHLCRVRHCVNPAHLEPVTIGENVLRGIGLSAENARKTHCKRGHEFTPNNTGIDRRGDRFCKHCASDNTRRFRERKRAERVPPTPRDDRCVHAASSTGSSELVRYDGPGKWYLERRDLGRRSVNLQQAAELAVHWYATGGTIYLGRCGGRQFDARVKALQKLASA